MAGDTRLSTVIDDYFFAIQADGMAKNTVKSKRGVLNRLLSSTGNIYVKNIEPVHIDKLMTELAKTHSPAVLNLDHSVLARFFKWCILRRLIPHHKNPMEGRKVRKVQPKKRRMLEVAEFGAMLDAANHPRDRMVIALGLYLFLRSSEMVTLTIGDVDLLRGEMDVEVWKTGDRDIMPLSLELDRELRRWLTFYAENAGPLQKEWLLVPAKHSVMWRQDPATNRLVRVDGEERLKPLAKMNHIEHIVQRSLEKLGYETRGERGESLRDGIHVLRRSGARALFDRLRSMGYDGALQQVRAMLHHADGSMTEKYLDVNVERMQRNELLKGQAMYPVSDENVVELRRASGGGHPGAGRGV